MTRAFILATALAIGTWAAATPSPAAASSTLLPAAEAFQLAHVARSGETLIVHWAIAPGYAVFRDRTKATAGDATVKVGSPLLPRGRLVEDELGNVEEEFEDGFEMRVPVKASSVEATVALTVQGCHLGDPRVCLLPYTVRVRIPSDGG